MYTAFPTPYIGVRVFPRLIGGEVNGLTDETSIVFWFQSKSFTIDLRLPDGAATPLVDRQGWVGDTLWELGTARGLAHVIVELRQDLIAADEGAARWAGAAWPWRNGCANAR